MCELGLKCQIDGSKITNQLRIYVTGHLDYAMWFDLILHWVVTFIEIDHSPYTCLEKHAGS